jgi:hypothetical protein
MLMVTPAVEGIDLFKKGNVAITVEQNSSPNKALELIAENGS